MWLNLGLLGVVGWLGWVCGLGFGSIWVFGVLVFGVFVLGVGLVVDFCSVRVGVFYGLLWISWSCVNFGVLDVWILAVEGLGFDILVWLLGIGLGCWFVFELLI